VDNAFKFSPIGGIVELKVTPGADGGVTLQIRDEGPGIPPDRREKVFERYFQGSSGDNREFEGLGVGLYIARSVFNSLGGQVIVLDTPTGCRVEASLPDRRPDDIVYG
jgi:signal transduction histidine kinase